MKFVRKEGPAILGCECMARSARVRRRALRNEMYAPMLKTHPLFRLWGDVSPSTLRELTDQIADFSFHSAPDDIFVAGHKCETAFYLVKGTLTYVQDPESSIVLDKTKKKSGRTRGSARRHCGRSGFMWAAPGPLLRVNSLACEGAWS